MTRKSSTLELFQIFPPRCKSTKQHTGCVIQSVLYYTFQSLQADSGKSIIKKGAGALVAPTPYFTKPDLCF
ncbi:hypothetical protein CO179_05465 [candidate division WWE3 bacterium CG_4_9_14_3_um_filter_39_7]|uniref:Uncharacterized protein n=1 Tax=candidate division WWE3 bacterium CG_4_9_14_3_um_filter_39_7 TaxID=1975080 RepID=A0A2M7X045_UNCKA|nr:MAG: hypothetical protein CO179_05465 [candidate division WWE3 bacterium CG_4_9_14_3_um_filter_39_7]